MEQNSLLLTLGHNSSAIFVYDDGNKIIGYEQERLSGIKADSQFPKDAINEIINNVGYEQVKNCSIFISHWFNDKGLDKPVFCKYMTEIDYENLLNISTNIVFTNKHFTHHDAHAFSALAFFENQRDSSIHKLLQRKVYTIVADGFGTNEEVISIYSCDYKKDNTPKLEHRVYGYESSVGLMYQYATSFCGMKENQDEYKFLGYESHIDEHLSDISIDVLDHLIDENVCYLYSKFNTHQDSDWLAQCTNDIVNYDKLHSVRKYWHNKLNDVVNTIFNRHDLQELSKEDKIFVKRCIVAYYVQQSIEIYFKRIIDEFEMSNVIVAGGCFYNVKLNNHILRNTKGLFCAMPLAGDQGAAIGMYRAMTGNKFSFATLAFGKRRLYNAQKYFDKPNNGMNYFAPEFKCDMEDIIDELAHVISNGYIVNLVFDNMEFGPRALCCTSTLFLPTEENVAANNHMNNRNEVMPCAPVCTAKNAIELFGVEDLSRVVGSDKYMICTHDYKKEISAQYAGVMHRKPIDDVYTGRPQIVNGGSFMHVLLERIEKICDVKCLVNTSFNAHGRPIAFDTMDILHNFTYQVEHAKPNKKPMLYVIDLKYYEQK